MHHDLSIIIPTLNEARNIEATLTPLQGLRNKRVEIIVIDGGSDDATFDLASPLSDRQLTARRGRAAQMNAGAAIAEGRMLLFLHADTRLTETALLPLLELQDTTWGRFDVRPDRAGLPFRVITTLMNWRSRITGIATGDQAIFVSRSLFEQAGGFPDMPLMEDIALSKRLKSIAKPRCLAGPAIISMRYWERHGVIRSILRMWRLRLAYFFRASPQRLYRRYYREP